MTATTATLTALFAVLAMSDETVEGLCCAKGDERTFGAIVEGVAEPAVEATVDDGGGSCAIAVVVAGDGLRARLAAALAKASGCQVFAAAPCDPPNDADDAACAQVIGPSLGAAGVVLARPSDDGHVALALRKATDGTVVREARCAQNDDDIARAVLALGDGVKARTERAATTPTPTPTDTPRRATITAVPAAPLGAHEAPADPVDAASGKAPRQSGEDLSAMWGGVGIGVAGTLATGAGVFLIGSSVLSTAPEAVRQEQTTLGVVVTALGVVATSVGVVLAVLAAPQAEAGS